MIGIKDFDMPYNCYDCELNNYHECDVTKESIEDDYCWNGDSREKHCPLVEAIPKSEYKTDLKIILNRLKVRMKDRDEDNGGEPLNAVDRGYHLAYEHLCGEIDNLLKEVENGNDD